MIDWSIQLNYLTTRSSSSLPTVLLLVGILRTLTCATWVYITSSDDHDIHDIGMIAYMVLTIPWMWGNTILSGDPEAKKWRRRVVAGFFGSIPPMIWFYIQHKVHKVAGGTFCGSECLHADV
jgi:hypothetical protein